MKLRSREIYKEKSELNKFFFFFSCPLERQVCLLSLVKKFIFLTSRYSKIHERKTGMLRIFLNQVDPTMAGKLLAVCVLPFSGVYSGHPRAG